jgi:uncharacterized protein
MTTEILCDSDSDDPDPPEHFGTGPYYNIINCVVLAKSKTAGYGLFATDNIPKGSIVWKDRKSGPSKTYYHEIKIEDMCNLPPDQFKIAVRYGYQFSETMILTPLTQEEIDLDYANYWNHSCEPNCLPAGTDTWIAARDITKDEELTIDYCTFDCNIYNCIDVCNCGAKSCRVKITGQDYRNKEMQQKYKDNFLPYVKTCASATV